MHNDLSIARFLDFYLEDVTGKIFMEKPNNSTKENYSHTRWFLPVQKNSGNVFCWSGHRQGAGFKRDTAPLACYGLHETHLATKCWDVV